jgi:hypothetical protein
MNTSVYQGRKLGRLRKWKERGKKAFAEETEEKHKNPELGKLI